MAEADEARALFDRALAELDVPIPTNGEAVMRLARGTAERIINGIATPYEGVKQIWELSLRLQEEHLSDLDSFVYAASEWEDRPEDRRVFEDGIVAAARELVRSAGQIDLGPNDCRSLPLDHFPEGRHFRSRESLAPPGNDLGGLRRWPRCGV